MKLRIAGNLPPPRRHALSRAGRARRSQPPGRRDGLSRVRHRHGARSDRARSPRCPHARARAEPEPETRARGRLALRYARRGGGYAAYRQRGRRHALSRRRSHPPRRGPPPSRAIGLASSRRRPRSRGGRNGAPPSRHGAYEQSLRARFRSIAARCPRSQTPSDMTRRPTLARPPRPPRRPAASPLRRRPGVQLRPPPGELRYTPGGRVSPTTRHHPPEGRDRPRRLPPLERALAPPPSGARARGGSSHPACAAPGGKRHPFRRSAVRGAGTSEPPLLARARRRPSRQQAKRTRAVAAQAPARRHSTSARAPPRSPRAQWRAQQPPLLGHANPGRAGRIRPRCRRASEGRRDRARCASASWRDAGLGRRSALPPLDGARALPGAAARHRPPRARCAPRSGDGGPAARPRVDLRWQLPGSGRV